MFQTPPAAKDKVGEPDQPGCSSAPPVEDQQQVPQPVKPPSPPPRPQLLYSQEVGTIHMTPTMLANCKEIKMWFSAVLLLLKTHRRQHETKAPPLLGN